jgi:glutaminase
LAGGGQPQLKQIFHMNYKDILGEIEAQLLIEPKLGKVASYIPELSKVDPSKLGMHLCCFEKGQYAFGNSEERFSIQSISKVFSLTLAINLIGTEVWQRVDVEPSGDPFNSLALLESENGIPRNPLINSGALVIADILVTQLDNPKKDFLEFVRKIAGQADINFNEKVAQSEKAWGFRNAALVNLMKAFGNIFADVEEVLDFYFHQCALEMSCRELANTFMLYANHGKLFDSGEEILTTSQTKRLNAVMLTCGFYDEAGEFSFRVGLPGKSGVGGGIAAIYPGKFSVAVWSPRLNEKGNSALGMLALEELTTQTGLSIF